MNPYSDGRIQSRTTTSETNKHRKLHNDYYNCPSTDKNSAHNNKVIDFYAVFVPEKLRMYLKINIRYFVIFLLTTSKRPTNASLIQCIGA
jgi:hypothetical protein